MNKTFDYDDINLIPQYSDIMSRNECDTSITIGKHIFKIPHIPANMESVITPEICKNLATNGYFYIMHRFLDFQSITEFISEMKEQNLITSISIGVKKEWYDFIDNLIKFDLVPDYITIDIAHGHSKMMGDMLQYLKEKEISSFIIAGNVSTVQGAEFLLQNGANGIKIGVGPGNVCTTAHNTKMGSRGMQASVVEDICKNTWLPNKENPFFIADGGIVNPGDTAVALALGAHATMCGKLFTGTDDSPGKVIDTKDGTFVEYWGSASAHQSGKTDRIEGTKKLMPYIGGTFLDRCKFLEQCFQSSMSYTGARTIEEYYKKINFIVKK